MSEANESNSEPNNSKKITVLFVHWGNDSYLLNSYRLTEMDRINISRTAKAFRKHCKRIVSKFLPRYIFIYFFGCSAHSNTLAHTPEIYSPCYCIYMAAVLRIGIEKKKPQQQKKKLKFE